ncbi:MAG: hypothetical protein ACJ8AH_18580, partial [Stellaceae bacterium]
APTQIAVIPFVVSTPPREICARKTGALGKDISTHRRTITQYHFAAPGTNRPCALAAYIRNHLLNASRHPDTESKSGDVSNLSRSAAMRNDIPAPSTAIDPQCRIQRSHDKGNHYFSR